MLRAYKCRLKPTQEQRTFFEKSFGCTRYIYNWALAKRIEAYQTEGNRINAIDLYREHGLSPSESTSIAPKGTLLLWIYPNTRLSYIAVHGMDNLNYPAVSYPTIWYLRVCPVVRRQVEQV